MVFGSHFWVFGDDLMGKQINFDFDDVDEEMLVTVLQRTEPWLAIPTPTPASSGWDPLEQRGRERIALLLCPARLAEELGTLNDPRRTAGRVLVWSRTALPVDHETEIGSARIWIDTRVTDQTVLKAFGAVSRAIATHSPKFASAGGAPIYIGPHLASQFDTGALKPVWPNGTPAKLQPNPRFKSAAEPKPRSGPMRGGEERSRPRRRRKPRVESPT